MRGYGLRAASEQPSYLLPARIGLSNIGRGTIWMESPPSYTCPECLVGILRPRKSSYFTMEEGHLITVPDFPAWVCDVCGRREYDTAALAELNAMLETDRRLRRRPKRPAPGGEQDKPSASADRHHRP
jgi:YgiT-type zinc finger domain-containing protein